MAHPAGRSFYRISGIYTQNAAGLCMALLPSQTRGGYISLLFPLSPVRQKRRNLPVQVLGWVLAYFKRTGGADPSESNEMFLIY